MAKSKEELASLVERITALNEELNELSDEELEQVTGGFHEDSAWALIIGMPVISLPEETEQ